MCLCLYLLFYYFILNCIVCLHLSHELSRKFGVHKLVLSVDIQLLLTVLRIFLTDQFAETEDECANSKAFD